MRDRDGQSQAPECLGDGALIPRIGKREEEADRDRLRTRPLDAASNAPDFRAIRPEQDLAAGGRPFGHTPAERARDERRFTLDVRVVEPRSGLAADLDQVLETRGCDKCDARSTPFEQSVGANGCAVDDLNSRRQARFGACRAQAADSFQHAASRVVRG